MVEQRGPVLLKRRLGRRLRELRERAGLTLNDAAGGMEFSPSKLSRVETGVQLITVHELKSMMDLYDHFDAELLEMARKAKEKGWWRSYGLDNRGYVAVEADACLVRNMELVQVPGLMQTPDYARARLSVSSKRRSRESLDNQVAIRSIRQQRLIAADGGLELAAVVDEAALRKPVGGVEVMRAQLRHMAELTALPNVTLHVLPTAGGPHTGMDGAFTVLSFPDAEDPELVYLDYPGGSVHIEKVGEVDECKLVFEQLRSVAFVRWVAQQL
jgi:transcriptional regulator with XRE-family HTH domain